MNLSKKAALKAAKRLVFAYEQGHKGICYGDVVVARGIILASKLAVLRPAKRMVAILKKEASLKKEVRRASYNISRVTSRIERAQMLLKLNKIQGQVKITGLGFYVSAKAQDRILAKAELRLSKAEKALDKFYMKMAKKGGFTSAWTTKVVLGKLIESSAKAVETMKESIRFFSVVIPCMIRNAWKQGKGFLVSTIKRIVNNDDLLRVGLSLF